MAVSSHTRRDRERLAELADEQAALRRIATLVARGVPAAAVFGAVADEVHRLLRADITSLNRFELDGRWTLVAARGSETRAMRVGDRWHPGTAAPGLADVLDGHAARVDGYGPIGSALDDIVGAEGVRAWVASPIVLMGRTWGVIVVLSRKGPLPPHAEDRLHEFSELVGTAIANAESRAQLVASRARIVAAGDEARRRIQRDLHDGAQQRVVTLAIKIKLLAASDAARASGVSAELAELLADAQAALEELRQISHGLHPPLLSKRGLEPALRALGERSPIPVALNLRVPGRLPEPVEIAAYYVVAEMLTNAAKHANASRVDVAAHVVDGALRVSVRDDGVGGADPAAGSGLVGLVDRVEAQSGTLTIDSPRGGGTTLVATLPLTEAAA